jgi:aspartate/methionine/tyrosine aminotransferase
VPDISAVTGFEVVESHDLVAFCQKAITHVGTYEACGSGDNDSQIAMLTRPALWTAHNDTSMRVIRSPYMEWAKTNFTTPPQYNLASSGLGNVLLSEIEGLQLTDLEITGKSYYGYEPLQSALSKHTGAPPECIFAATGTSMGNLLSMAATLERGDEVLFEHPVYDLLTSAAGFLEADINFFPRRPENGFRIDVNEVARHISPYTRLIVVTNLHNPSSVYTPPGILQDLAALARSVGARVLVDEVYLDSAFDLEPGSSAYRLGPEFIVTNSLTKVYGLSGLRCGWVVANDPDFIRKLWRLNDLFGVIPAHPAERLSVIALSQIERLRMRAKAILDRNRALVNDFLRDIGQPQVAAGTVAFPSIPRSEHLTRILREKYDTAVVPGTFFEMPDHLRIGFGGSAEVLEQGLQRIRLAMAEGGY